MSSDTSINFGNNLRAIRQRRGLSSEQVAMRLADQGVQLSGRAIRNYENGERECTVDMMVHLAVALDCSLQTLLAGLDPRMDGDERQAEFKLLTPFEHGVFSFMATEWDGDRHALILFDALYMALPPKYRREAPLSLFAQAEMAVRDGAVRPEQLPPNMDYLEQKWRELYKK